jgi:hypothetical protein
MNSTNNKVLIICYNFPPNEGIGGRRWAKIAKYLNKEKYKVYALRADKKINLNSPWKKDIENIHQYSISIPYPLNKFEKKNSNIIQKVVYKLSIKFLQLTTRGTIYDLAVYSRKRVLNAIDKIVKQHQINTIIATGAPFNLLYYAAIYKKHNPHIKLICDYRDPWLNAYNYGMNNLSPKRKKFEQFKQDFILENADYITAPNSKMLKDIKSQYKGQNQIRAQFYEIQHGFDEDDFSNRFNNQETAREKIKILYGGCLYEGTEPYLKQLNKWLTDLKDTPLYSKLEISFYTNETENKKWFSENEQVVRFYLPIGKEIFTKAKTSDFFMIFLADHNKDFLTTKFFEFLPFKLPYLYFGPRGVVADEIEAGKLGTVVEDAETLKRVLLSPPNVNDRDLSSYTIQHITRRFIKEVLEA